MSIPTLLQTRQSHRLALIEGVSIIEGLHELAGLAPQAEGKPLVLMANAEWEALHTDLDLWKDRIHGLVGCVEKTCQALGLPEGWGRFNDWPGPVKPTTPKVLEIACHDKDMTQRLVNRLAEKGARALPCPDEPGLISARIIYMILAEGLRLFGDGLAAATDIDLSMKLGTNYSEGPIAWARLWGGERLTALQEALHRQDAERYPSVSWELLEMPA